MERLPKLIKSRCTQNNNFLKEKQNSSLGYVLFNNGYYDFKNDTFYDKATHKFNCDIVFFGKIHHDYNITTNKTEQDLIDFMKQSFFITPLGKGVGEYLLTLLARALKGDVMKIMPFMLGPSNAGKSVLWSLFLASLGDYAGSFNAENLAFRLSNNDKAQIMRWLLLLRYKRIIFSNEMQTKADLNGNMIKWW